MELIKTGNPRVEKLVQYLQILCTGICEKENYDSYRDILETATPFEVNKALSIVLAGATSFSDYMLPVSRFFRSVGKSLDSQIVAAYPPSHILSRLSAENTAIAALCSALQVLSKQVHLKTLNREVLVNFVASFGLLNSHYTALQNELFPLFEKATVDHACVKLMWSIQDLVLDAQKKIIQFDTSLSMDEFWKLFGKFFSLVEILVYRETRVLFPVAYRAISQEYEKENSLVKGVSLARFVSNTGSLAFGELEAIFKLLPLDIAFITADDKVAFYSDPPHRIFPRSPAVLKRLVQNCHPMKSVQTVEAILSSFKDGSKDSAEFYLTVQGRFIHIEYFAVKNNQGTYLGTLEVTQDATRLRALEGEKRL
ncbi:hypothetical protein SpiGrapes_0073 [Sphaerochaeta pleomorpha str. Grapes]|uniref:Hemerythrin-like domain-containing protein n=1 Tax=Sphaerochaeta pleomorpha (strain ATCC BAA-1885 / DSM 22778 / Grapes) TaxID=158190 RepID=G8QT32_SPHPG|nr:PAS domain-containing protein [Sphaerochaeta pleomorpha]AEV27937.1 hypothetical protein SpiGrapes_0073 [Sphaerochaeta pleomorpha str. Grapes]